MNEYYFIDAGQYVLGAINVNDAIKRLKWGKSLVSL